VDENGKATHYVLTLQNGTYALGGGVMRFGDDADLKEVYDTERHLLYVACTRARDHLLVTGVTPTSEYLDDLLGGQ
jgi:superfamily I DNA/RNA helicase